MKILRAFFRLWAPLLISMLCLPCANSQSAVTTDPPFYGPYNAIFLPDGDGLRKPADAKAVRKEDSIGLQVEVHNTGTVAALANKLTLVNASDGSRILPAYYSDNYFSLLPGEAREIEIEYPAKSAAGPAQLTLRGWNLEPHAIPAR